LIWDAPPFHDAGFKTVGSLSRLVQLDLRQTKITDAGLESLTSLKNLRTLNLYGTERDGCWPEVARSIKTLKTVYLFGTKATPAGAKQLASALPGAQVVLK
jgi:hypothetical protein